MKATIYLNGTIVFESSRISRERLDKVENQIKQANGCQKMADQVLKGYKVFTR